jgi:Methylase involved in ubiquinone/menaquinone biosynthesis
MPYEDNTSAAAASLLGSAMCPTAFKGLKEMARVTKPGGKVVVLELTEPTAGFMAPFARFHVHQVVPFMGALLSGRKEYHYLQKSIAAFPPPTEFVGLMQEAGLTDVEAVRLSFGAAHLFIGAVAGS